MTALLELRETLKNFYVRNEIYLYPLIKFTVALISLLMINNYMGYMELLKHVAVVLVISLTCSFLPKNFIVIVSALYVLMHTYALALECAIVMLAVLAIMFFLYFRYSPKDTLVVLLTPLCFILKVPFIMPVALGLLSAPLSAISLSCGTIVYFIIKFMSDNIAIFSATDAQTGSQKLKVMLDGILDNKAMFITVIVFVLTLIIVYAIRRSSMDHSWNIAMYTGISVSVVLLLICEFLFDLKFSVVSMVIGAVVSLGVCMIIQFLEFNVDYSRTEIVQFEDDEYYYYVKAVPKNILSAPEKKVKRINRQIKGRTVKASQKQEVSRASMSSGAPVRLKNSQNMETPKTIKTANGVSRTAANRENKE